MTTTPFEPPGDPENPDPAGTPGWGTTDPASSDDGREDDLDDPAATEGVGGSAGDSAREQPDGGVPPV